MILTDASSILAANAERVRDGDRAVGALAGGRAATARLGLDLGVDALEVGEEAGSCLDGARSETLAALVRRAGLERALVAAVTRLGLGRRLRAAGTRRVRLALLDLVAPVPSAGAAIDSDVNAEYDGC